MNVFEWAAAALIVLELPLLALVVVCPRIDALAGLQAASTQFTLALVLLAQAFHRSAYTVVGLVAAFVTFAGSMAFVRFFEHELDP